MSYAAHSKDYSSQSMMAVPHAVLAAFSMETAYLESTHDERTGWQDMSRLPRRAPQYRISPDMKHVGAQVPGTHALAYGAALVSRARCGATDCHAAEHPSALLHGCIQHQTKVYRQRHVMAAAEGNKQVNRFAKWVCSTHVHSTGQSHRVRIMNTDKTNKKSRADVSVKMDVADIEQILLERICLLRYKPGDQLKEAELAREFGVSRTPIRDALSRIRHLGMIESRNGVGTVVVALAEKQIKHIYEMRLELACLIGKLSPRKPTHKNYTAIQKLLKRAQKLQTQFDGDAYILINHELHEVIASMIGNESLRAMWLQTYVQASSTWYIVTRGREVEVTQALLDELTDLLNAISHRDIEAVGYIQRIHIKYGYSKVLEYFNINTAVPEYKDRRLTE